MSRISFYLSFLCALFFVPSLRAEHSYHGGVFDVSQEGGAPSRQLVLLAAFDKKQDGEVFYINGRTIEIKFKEGISFEIIVKNPRVLSYSFSTKTQEESKTYIDVAGFTGLWEKGSRKPYAKYAPKGFIGIPPKDKNNPEGTAIPIQFDAVHFSGETLVFEAKIAPRVDKNEVDKMAEIKNKTYDQYTTLFVGDGYFGDDA